MVVAVATEVVVVVVIVKVKIDVEVLTERELWLVPVLYFQTKIFHTEELKNAKKNLVHSYKRANIHLET